MLTDAYIEGILERSDLLACHRIIILVLSLNLEGLTTRELMGKAGTRNHNRRALQRQLQYLMVKGIVKREVFVFRNLNDHYNHHAHYRLSSPYAIKVRENSMRTQLMPSETFLRSTIARDDLLPGQRIVLLALAFAPPQGMLTAELAEASGCSLPNTILYCKVLGDKGLAECINLGNPNKPVWRFKIKAAT